MASRCTIVAATSVGLALTTLATPAAATDNRPRSVVSWTPAACATLVDRSVDPVVDLAYTPAFEEGPPEPGEVADGRRFQFFATCEALDANHVMPTWITWDDVDAAAAAIGKFDPLTVLAEQVLDDAASGWTDCAHRITTDDARIPITNADAAAGVDWDTTGVPAGVYIVHGYTWDPTINMWQARPGFVKVHDGDPAAAGPAIALTSTWLEPIYADEVALLQGCVDASPSATLDVSWSRDNPVQWVPYLRGEPVDGDAFAIEFMPPMDAVGDSLLIRVDVHDGDRTYTAHISDLLTVLQPPAGGTCEGGFVPGPDCPDTDGPPAGDDTGPSGSTSDGATSGTTSDAATGTSVASGGADGATGDDGSCACRAHDRRSGPAGALFLLMVAVARRGRARH